MGFFTRKKVSKAPVDQWDSKDVQAWAKRVAGLPKPCRKALKPVTGEVLVNLTSEDLDIIFRGYATTIEKAKFLISLQSLKECGDSSDAHPSPPQSTDENCSNNTLERTTREIVKTVSKKSPRPLGSCFSHENAPVLSATAVKHSRTLQAAGQMDECMHVNTDGTSPGAAEYETATIDTLPPPKQNTDRTVPSQEQTVYDGLNLSVAFDPIPPRQDLSQASVELHADSAVHIQVEDWNDHAAEQTCSSQPSGSSVLEPLKVMQDGSQTMLDHIEPEAEPSSIKPSSMRTSDTVSVHSSRLDTLSAERVELRQDLGEAVEAQLVEHFLSFANFSNHGEPLLDMDGVHFAKYCSDTRIIGGGVTRTDVDLAFAVAKAKGTRRINFDQFLRALKDLGERRGIPLSDMVQVCLMNDGPINHSATKMSNVRLHDDKSTYTGIYKRGGPDTMDGGAKSLQQITNRKPADARGVQFQRSGTSGEQALPRRHASDTSARMKSISGASTLTPSSMGGLPNALSMPEPTTSRRSGASGNAVQMSEKLLVTSSNQITDWDELNQLERVFASFAVFGKGRGVSIAADDIRMDSKSFAKLVKEAGVMHGKLNLTRVDLCFTKSCDKVSKRMSFEQFQHALEECAAAKGEDIGMFTQQIAQCQPMVHGTVAGHVKWHDDRSMYTGVYAHGGPTNVDKKISFGDIVNRDARPPSGRRGSIATWAN